MSVQRYPSVLGVVVRAQVENLCPRGRVGPRGRVTGELHDPAVAGVEDEQVTAVVDGNPCRLVQLVEPRPYPLPPPR